MTPDPVISLETLHESAHAIFTNALDACNIPTAFDRHLHFEGNTLVRHPSPEIEPVSIPLDPYKKIFVISFGKAALTMLDALLERLPAKINLHGVCSAPEIPKKRNRHIVYYAGGHPLPNKQSIAAAQATFRLLRSAGKDTFIFFLISGGGSAMLELPIDNLISLPDTIAFHQSLVASGATITEVNTVRKFFSAVKGGRLALAAPDAEKLTLLLADVPLKDLAAVASSPTLPDLSTPTECLEILTRYNLLEKFPASVRKYFKSLKLDRPIAGSESSASASAKTFTGKEPLTDDKPAAKSGLSFRQALNFRNLRSAALKRTPLNWESTAEAPVPVRASDPRAFEHAQFDTLLSNHDFVNAARANAEGLGFHVVVDNTCDDWDYADASRYLLERFHELRREFPRLCLLSSGEVTVQLGSDPGCGGRNQQFALASAFELDRYPGESLAVLSAGSDGIDGNSPAAGAIADTTTIARARDYRFDPEATLAKFNACPLFTALGDTIVTGPTGNNLRDLRILLATR